MATNTFLDASTAHVTKVEMEAIEALAEAQRLDETKVDPLIPLSAEGRYGAWLYVPELDEADDNANEDERRDRFPNLQTLIELARKRGCRFINLDGAGDIVPGLPEYEW